MIVFVNDPKRTVISVSIPEGKSIAERFRAILADYGLKYEREEQKKNRTIFRDISGKGKDVSAFLKSMEEIEWDRPENYYILVSGRRKGGKKYEHGTEDRGEIREGRESGDQEGTDPAGGYGEAAPDCGDPAADRAPGAGADPGNEESAGNCAHCDQ